MNTYEILYEIIQKPEIIDFCGVYQNEEIKNIIEFILISSFAFIREHFSKIPTFELIKNLIQDAFTKYSASEEIQKIREKLNELKTETKYLGVLFSDKEIERNPKEPRKKPPSDWRKGDKAVFKNDLTKSTRRFSESKKKTYSEFDLDVYPKWWLDLRETKEEKQNSQKHKKSAKSSSVVTLTQSKAATPSPVKPLATVKSLNPPTDTVSKIPNSASSSSTSAFYPSPEMKKFYQSEFRSLFGNTLLSTPQSHKHNYS